MKALKLILLGLIFITNTAFGQKQNPLQNFNPTFPSKTVLSTQIKQSTLHNKQPVKDGTIYLNPEKGTVKGENALQYIAEHFELNDNYSFKKFRDEENRLGFHLYAYKEVYKGLTVFGKEILLHTENGSVKRVRGKISNKLELDITPTLSAKAAFQLAQADLKITNSRDSLMNELIIYDDNGVFKLAYQILVETKSISISYDVFVDAKTGVILNKISNITNEDVQTEVSTHYSGEQTLTTYLLNDDYYLYDSDRNIITKSLNNEDNFSNVTNYTTSTNLWNEEQIVLDNITITYTSDWWNAANVGQCPDIRIRIFNGSGDEVEDIQKYDDCTNIYFNNLELVLSDFPYTVKIYERDSYGWGAYIDYEYSGSFTIDESDTGFNSWSTINNGTNYGTFSTQLEASSEPKPHLDAHWGAARTIDYFSETFGRNSFDDEGSLLTLYTNWKTGYANAGWSSNNFIVLGDGDGYISSYRTYLNVIGHEFTHGLIDYEADLIYEGEAGALNESFADIFGTAIEFFAKPETADWNHGEEGYLISYNSTTLSGGFVRSLENPKLKGQPDTYGGDFWKNPLLLTDDYGGVHRNSGVQNYWFYLLTVGGQGTNDNGDSYIVNGIGIDKSSKITYRNLTEHLTNTSDFHAAYIGSIGATEDLISEGVLTESDLYSVRQAWHAVGVAPQPELYCDNEVTVLTDIYGTVSDGSGNAEYLNNTNCSWVIKPQAANKITIHFNEFNLENGYDFVRIYNGVNNDSNALIAVLTGEINSYDILASTFETDSDVGAILIEFSSDLSETSGGWSFEYYTDQDEIYCDGYSVLSESSGVFDDGSGINNYSNNQSCAWLIAPPCADSIYLEFNLFSTELGFDSVWVFDGNTSLAPLLYAQSGNWWPNQLESITSTSGEMLVIFYSDFTESNHMGFEAYYNSYGSINCTETTLLTDTSGIVSDYSGDDVYCNNSECYYLIQPENTASIELEFTEFDVEESPFDDSYYDYVQVFDGDSENSPLIGTFTGSVLPETIQSSGGSLYLKFKTDVTNTQNGWSANWTTNPIEPVCSTSHVVVLQSSDDLGWSNNSLSLQLNNSGSSIDSTISLVGDSIAFYCFDVQIDLCSFFTLNEGNLEPGESWSLYTSNFDLITTNTGLDFSLGCILGCTNPSALNYNVLANFDDDNCELPIYGCTDNNMFNYDNEANTDDGTCIPYMYGCMDETALNYNIEANANDNCIGIEIGCTDNGEVFEDLVNNITGALISDGIDDDYHYDIDGDGLMALNYNPNANIDDGSCNPVVYGCTDDDALNFNMNATNDDGTCIIEIFGCTDPLALNYNSIVTTDNGSCSYSIGCKDPNYIEYNEVAIETDNTLCITLIIEGCTDEAYLEYNPLANTLVLFECVNLIEYGCTDETAFNYNTAANTDDGSCEEVLLGCTDPSALNYNNAANTDNGSCIDVVYGCTDSYAFNYNPLANTNNDTCIEITEGCTDNTAFNYNEFANVNDNSCIAIVYGCIDSEAFNYNEDANTENGTCEEIVLGCTDELAFNYELDANTDNGNCIEVIYGCMDAYAENFNAEANTADQNCEYSEYEDLLSTYCYPEEEYNSATHHILRFVLDTLDSGYNSSLSNGSTTYTDNSDMVVGLEVGSSYSTFIQLIHQTYGGQIGVDVYIDYNRDGDFEEANEKCYQFTNNFSSNSTGTHNINTSITVPEGISPGLTKIRVVTYLLSEFPASTNHSCITNYQGEIEDYTANLINDVFGCTDELAENYNSFATTDDGNCDYLGCTNVNSINYNSIATIDNYSCIFSTEFSGYEIFLQPFANFYPLYWTPYGESTANIFEDYGSSNGEVNTDMIIDTYGTDAIYAAQYCYDLEDYGYTDWYLPSSDELGEFHSHISSEWATLDYYSNTESVVNPDATITCCYSQPNTSAGRYYWTSNENNPENKASLRTIFGNSAWADTKTNPHPVRCVRNNAVYGCTFENSFNYDSTANLDDGTCDSLPTSQSIVLPNGWSMFSTYIAPTNTDMMDILAPIVENIAITKDYLGGAYLPEWGFNGIGNITNGQAYQTKIDNLSDSNTEIELIVSGSYLLPENTPIQIEAGWNMIGYLRTDEVSTVSILADLNDSGNLVIAKDYLGGAYLPEWGFNGIGLMEPGKGYQVKTITEDVLEYLPMNQEYRNSTIEKTDNTPTHYGWSKITDHNMSIVILDEAWEQKPNIGSEIGVFNNIGIQVGSVKYTSPVSVVTVWGDDTQTENIDGLLKNESLALKLWDSETRKELELKVSSWISGGDFYETNAIHQIGSISQEQHASDSFEFISCVPNPANSKTTINVQLSEQSQLKLYVTNILGEQLITKNKYELEKGLNKINLETINLEPGSYFVHLVINGIKQTKVLSIIK